MQKTPYSADVADLGRIQRTSGKQSIPAGLSHVRSRYTPSDLS